MEKMTCAYLREVAVVAVAQQVGEFEYGQHRGVERVGNGSQ